MSRIQDRLGPWVAQVAVYGVISAFFFLAQHAQAQSLPAEFTYQGRLTDTFGVPVTGTVTMTFRLYDVDVGGSPLWEETQSLITVDEGIFTVFLGSVEPFDAYGIAFSQQYWLEIVVEGDQMSSRMALVPVPYAHYATNAGLLDGVVVEELEESLEVVDALHQHEADFHPGAPHESLVLQIDATSDLDVDVVQNAGAGVAEKVFSFTAAELDGADYLSVEVSGKFHACSIFYANYVGLEIENLATGVTVFSDNIVWVFGSSHWAASQCYQVQHLITLTEDERATGTQIRLRVTATIDQDYLAPMHSASFTNSQIVFSIR